MIPDDVSCDLDDGFRRRGGGARAGKSTLLSALAGSNPMRASHPDGAPLGVRPAHALAARAHLPQNPRAEWSIAVERLVALA